MTALVRVHHEKFVGSLFFVGVLAVSTLAAAQETIVMTPESAVTHLTWRAEAGCPSEDDVQALALERMTSSPDGTPLLLLDVRADVSAVERGFEGTLRAGDVERRFSSPSCTTIARAVALVFSEWVIEGPAPSAVQVVETEAVAEPPVEAETTETVEVATETVEAEVEVATETVEAATEAVEEAETVAEPVGRGAIRFVGGLLLGYDAFVMPVVEPTALLSLGVGIDVLEIDVAPMGLGLTNFGLGSAEDARLLLYGGRLRVGVMFELSPEWELGGHLLTEVALITVSRLSESDRSLFATFGAGFDLRFYPDPMIGVGFSAQFPFPLGKSTLSLPSVGFTYEQDWATLVMGLGVVVRIR